MVCLSPVGYGVFEPSSVLRKPSKPDWVKEFEKENDQPQPYLAS